MEKTGISHYIKPRTLEAILRRNARVLGVRLLLLDDKGNQVACCREAEVSRSGRRGRVRRDVTVRGRLLGTLVGYEGPSCSGERLEAALENIADHLAELALSEIKLDSMSEELLHNYRVLNLFYTVSEALVNILNVRRVCQIILERIVSTIGLSKASVLLLDKSGDNLWVVAHHGLPVEEVENRLFAVEQSVCRDPIRTGKPLFVQDIDHYPGLKQRSRGRYRSRSFISVPILTGGRAHNRRVLGVINVADKLSGEPFFSGDMKLIMALTSLAAMAVQNARYFEEVERSKEEWEQTFDAITDSVAILDGSYRLSKVNKAYVQQYGFAKDELLDRACYRAFYRADAPCPGCPATRTLLTGEPAYAEKRVAGKTFRQWTYPVHDDAGRLSSVVIYTRDVTNLKRLKEELVRSERMASIGQIAAGMAHEIRNPLGSILTAVEVLSSGGSAREENFETLSRVIQVEARRLNGIISEFLLYAGPQRPRLRESHLNRVVEEVAGMIRGEAAKEGVALELDLDRSVGPSRFDPDRIKQVIWNILLNGIQAMEGGGTLSVATRRDGSGVSLLVRDQGPGIDPRHRNKIFDPFFTTKERGTGLGLSVVSRIVNDHDGTIEVRSEPGAGAEFVVTLPAGESGAAAAEAAGGTEAAYERPENPAGG